MHDNGIRATDGRPDDPMGGQCCIDDVVKKYPNEPKPGFLGATVRAGDVKRTPDEWSLAEAEEFVMLFLVRSQRAVKHQLAAQWYTGRPAKPATIHTIMRRLRAKLQPFGVVIKTVHAGYILMEEQRAAIEAACLGKGPVRIAEPST